LLFVDPEVLVGLVEGYLGVEVAATVNHCRVVKLDAEGRKRPWIDRKRDHLAAAAEATVPARAVMLADKLHNLLSIVVDHNAGRPVWSFFNAGRAEVLWYYHAMIDRLGTGDPRLEALAGRCREALAAVENLGEPDQKNG
jgi:guanosine-3',5'-bis(diphosphate) 3'-pyrophosphohydrolase